MLEVLEHSAISAITLNLKDQNSKTLVHKDQQAALNDLQRKGQLHYLNDGKAPYTMMLSTQDNHLIIEALNADGDILPALVLSLKPYAKIIKDYFLIVQSYETALKSGKHAHIEAIDMGRRGLHNEGADLLKERLKDKISMDHITARCLFTLFCVLHHGKNRSLLR